MKNCRIMMVITLLSGFYLAGCSGNGAGQSDTETRAVPNSQLFVAGKALFDNNCAVCHGNDGTAGIAGAANLQLSRGTTATFVKTISEGRNGMPGFKTRLNEKEIKAVANYVRGLQH